MSKHTEGPWHWELHHLGDYRITDETGRVVVETRPDGNQRSTGNERENARLIAAAPELLAAARVALTWYEHPAVHDAFRSDELLYARLNEAIILARAAVAKASGPAS